jgi:hypothetical protein
MCISRPFRRYVGCHYLPCNYRGIFPKVCVLTSAPFWIGHHAGHFVFPVSKLWGWSGIRRIQIARLQRTDTKTLCSKQSTCILCVQPSLECGFQHIPSSVGHLITLEEQARNTRLTKQFLRGIFFDIDKACDTIWWHGILQTCDHWQLKFLLLIFLSDFLSDRRF